MAQTKNDTSRDLSALVRAALEQTEKSQRDVADEAGVSTRTIYELKQGKRTPPLSRRLIRSVARLAVALDEGSIDYSEWLSAAGLETNHHQSVIKEARDSVGASDVLAPKRGLERLANKLGDLDRPVLACALYTSPPAGDRVQGVLSTIKEMVNTEPGVYLAMCVPYLSGRQISNKGEVSKNSSVALGNFYDGKSDLPNVGDSIKSKVKYLARKYRSIANVGKKDRIRVFQPNSELAGFQAYPYLPNQSRPFYTIKSPSKVENESEISPDILSEYVTEEDQSLESWSKNRDKDEERWYHYPYDPEIYSMWRSFFGDIVESFIISESKKQNEDWCLSLKRKEKNSIWEEVKVI